MLNPHTAPARTYYGSRLIEDTGVAYRSMPTEDTYAIQMVVEARSRNVLGTYLGRTWDVLGQMAQIIDIQRYFDAVSVALTPFFRAVV